MSSNMTQYYPGMMLVFGLSWESNLVWKWSSPPNDASWTGWVNKEGVVVYDPLAIVRVKLEFSVFTVNKNHSLMQANYVSGNAAGSPWKDLGGKLNGPPIAVNSKGVVHIFHVGTDHALYHKTWDGVSYSPGDLTYTKLEAKTRFRPGSLAAVSLGEEEATLFAIGLLDSSLYRFHWTLANGWGEAEKLTGLWDGCLSLTSHKPGCWDLFGLNMKSGINHLSFDSGNFSTLKKMPGQFLSIDAVSSESDTLELFTMGCNSSVYHNTFSKGYWKGWLDLRLPIAQRPAPICHTPGALSVICNGKDSVIYIRTRDPTYHSWGNSWTNIQGIIVSGLGVIS